MPKKWQNFLVGLMGIGGIICLCVILLLFGYIPPWFEGGYDIHIELNQSGGLTEDSRVRLSGVDIGRVQSVTLQAPPKRGVIILTRIRSDVQIPINAHVTVVAHILGGSPALEFDLDQLEENEMMAMLPTDGNARVKGRVPNLASRVSAEMQAVLDGPFEQFTHLSRAWTRLGENFNKLVEPRSTDEVTAGRFPANLSTILERGDGRITELKSVLAGLNALFNDPKLTADIRNAAASASTMTKKVTIAADRFSSLATETGQNIDQLADSYVTLADNLSTALTTMHRIVEKINKGEGTASKLLNDPAVFNNLNDALERINLAVDDLRLLLEKWKQEGVPIRL